MCKSRFVVIVFNIATVWVVGLCGSLEVEASGTDHYRRAWIDHSPKQWLLVYTSVVWGKTGQMWNDSTSLADTAVGTQSVVFNFHWRNGRWAAVLWGVYMCTWAWWRVSKAAIRNFAKDTSLPSFPMPQ